MAPTTRPEIGQVVRVKTHEENWTIEGVNPTYDGYFITLTHKGRRLITHTDDVTHVNGIRV